MTAAVVAGVLLTTGLLVAVVATLGLWVMPDGLDRLHLGGLLSSGASVLVAAAVIVDGMPVAASLELGLVVLVLAVGAPMTSHALARSFRVRQHGGWDSEHGVLDANEITDRGGDA